MTAATGYIAATAALLQHKSRNGHSISPNYNENRVAASLSRLEEPSWVRVILGSLGPDAGQAVDGAQSRCSGIDLAIQLIEDITDPDGFDLSSSYVDHVRKLAAQHATAEFPILGRVDWDAIEGDAKNAKSLLAAADIVRKALVAVAYEHSHSIDLFTPHLARIPRDIDGKLVLNKDAACSPPPSIVGPVSHPFNTPTSTDRETAVCALSQNGIVVISNAVPLDVIESVREKLRITSSFSLNPKRFDTRETNPQKIFGGDRATDVACTQLAGGRYSYQLRCSPLESVVKPVHAGVMPVVWSYLLRQRKDSLLNKIAGQSVPDGTPPRVFLSEVSLVCSDPLAGQDSWHATNGAGGVVVLVPLSPYEKGNGNTVCLPGSHRAWSGIGGILKFADTALKAQGEYECTADCGDAIVMDARTLRMTKSNELFNKSRVWLAFHYDFTDRPGPSQWLPRTLFMNALAAGMVRIERLYRKLPPVSA